MVKLISGSFMVIFGIMFSVTGLGFVIGFPMFCAGIGTAALGLIQMGVFAVKTGASAGKVVREMNLRSGAPVVGATIEGRAAPAASIADEIAKLATLKDAGHLTEDEFSAKKAQLLGG